MRPAIINTSNGKWAFEKLANILSEALWVEIQEKFCDINYTLCIEESENYNINNFIPINSIKIAADKRNIEKRFNQFSVARPKTFVVQDEKDVESILSEHFYIKWILKYPIGCGGINHRFIEKISQIPKGWPKPFLLQEFIELQIPEVYRLYCVDSEIFGFNARRFQDKNNKNPWVSHQGGAIYEYGESPEKEAQEVVKAALISTDLYNSFGVVDLLKNKTGKWYALEVGTDGIYNYVDREVGNQKLFDEINERLAKAFWKNIGNPPWGKTWKYRD
ncbi:MAG: ATP-grasp domain-containing protein [Scytonematopsis contorta HA4267-MV1]|jgi:glutathione synthase/RimK-type ligase-like ATP-grasp enzyme|nr:ATP-grasp domain-containing protein [Scytonematopsis contorta HA4267-MV1]